MVYTRETKVLTASSVLSNNNEIYIVNAIFSNIILTLPIIVTDGMFITISRTDQSTNTVTIDAAGALIIPPSTSTFALEKISTIDLLSKNGNWFVMEITPSVRSLTNNNVCGGDGTFSVIDVTSASNNTAFGKNALSDITTGTGNTAFGSSALSSISNGINNTGIGSSALSSVTTGINNTAIGTSALLSTISGDNNVAVGSNVLALNNASNNIGIGSGTLTANTSGFSNVAIGSACMNVNTLGSRNIGIGVSALFNSIGNDNIAIGDRVLQSNIESRNIGIGTSALNKNINGRDNISIGHLSLIDNVSGVLNVAIGTFALTNNTTSNQTAIGNNALEQATTGGNSTAVGSAALRSNTTGGNNTAVGVEALTNGNGVTFGGNVAVGTSAGKNSGGNQNTFLGFNADASPPSVSFVTAIGSGVIASSTNGFYARLRQIPLAPLANISYNPTGSFGEIGWNGIGPSDIRTKENIIDLSGNIDIIKQLKPICYQYKDRKIYNDNCHYGFSAQELETVIPYAVTQTDDFLPDVCYESNFIVNETETGVVYIVTKINHGLTNQSTVRMLLDDLMIVEKITVIDTDTFSFNSKSKMPSENNKIYISGTQINDLRHVDKDYVFTVTTGAVKELIAENESLKQEIVTLKSRLTTLETQVSQILSNFT